MKLQAEMEAIRLEKKNVELMALFASLDPSPLFRIDSKGIIILANEVALKVFSMDSFYGTKIGEIFSAISNSDFSGLINNSKSIEFESQIADKNFYIVIAGVSAYHFAQVYCYDVSTLKKTQTELKLLSVQLEELNAHMNNITEAERERIALDLHDGLGQILTSTKMKIEQIESKPGISEDMKNELHNLSEKTTNAMKSIREVLKNLKPASLSEFGLVSAVKAMTDDLNESTNIAFDLFASNRDSRYESDLEINIYRVIQELLNNIVKHSKASEVFIQIMSEEGQLRILIEDNGTGFNIEKISKSQKNRGYGLLGINERVKHCGGEIIIESHLDVGTEVMITLQILEGKAVYVN